MTAYLYAPQPRLKRTKKVASPVEKRNILTFSMVHPPLTHRTGLKKQISSTSYQDYTIPLKFKKTA